MEIVKEYMVTFSKEDILNMISENLKEKGLITKNISIDVSLPDIENNWSSKSDLNQITCICEDIQ